MGKKYKNICVYCENYIEYSRGTKPNECPYCGCTDWHKPKTEVKLFLLQNKYLKTRNNDYLGEMYEILVNYAQSMIKKLVSGNYRYDFNYLDVKSRDAVNKIIDYFLTKEDFRIESSFAGYLKFKIEEVLYNKKDKKREQLEESLNVIIDSETNKELQELLYLNNYKSVFNTDKDIGKELRNKNDLIRGLLNLIETYLDRIYENYSLIEYMLNSIALIIKIEGRNDDLSNFYKQYSDYEIEKNIESFMIIFYEFIKGN